MALQRNVRYAGRFLNPTTARPQGGFKNRTSPDSQDGSFLEADWANDWDGFFSSLLSGAGLTPNNTVDSVGNSQYYTALTSIISGNFQSLVEASGFVRVGNFIMQWGQWNIPSNNATALITLPTAYNQNHVWACATYNRSQGTTPDNAYVTSMNLTQIGLTHSGDDGSGNVRWLSIGK